MKFYRMSNGDIVTSIRPLIKTPGIKGIRVYDATNKSYCFEERAYRGSLYNIQAVLTRDPTVCLMGQLNKALKLIDETDEVEPEEESYLSWYNHARTWLQAQAREWQS